MRWPDSDCVGLLSRFSRPVRYGEAALDVGCGGGRHLAVLQALGWEALGIDADPGMVEEARLRGGHSVQHATLAGLLAYSYRRSFGLALAWGFTMLEPDAPAQLAALGARRVVCDWRDTVDNTCMEWDARYGVDVARRLAGPGAGTVRLTLRNPGHVLDGQVYTFWNREACELPGYRRIHCQRCVREVAGESNAWLQTVHEREDRP